MKQIISNDSELVPVYRWCLLKCCTANDVKCVLTLVHWWFWWFCDLAKMKTILKILTIAFQSSVSVFGYGECSANQLFVRMMAKKVIQTLEGRESARWRCRRRSGRRRWRSIWRLAKLLLCTRKIESTSALNKKEILGTSEAALELSDTESRRVICNIEGDDEGEVQKNKL